MKWEYLVTIEADKQLEASEVERMLILELYSKFASFTPVKVESWGQANENTTD